MSIPIDNPTPTPTPGPHERRHRRWLPIMLAANLGVPFLILPLMDQMPGVQPLTPSALIAPGILIVSFLGGATLIERHARRAKRLDAVQIAHASYRCCTRCRYNVSGLPSPGTCPECGCAYEHVTLERAWREHYEHANSRTKIE